MDISTANYFYAAYSFFWLLPTLFVIKTFRDVKKISQQLDEVKARLK